MSDYRLDYRETGVRSRAEAKEFSLASLARLALGPTQPPVQWVPRVLSPGVKCDQGMTLTTHPNLLTSSIMSRSYISSLPGAFMAYSETALLCISYYHYMYECIVSERHYSSVCAYI
jgi:hypothetical protein